jgi:hypothetical protein
LPGLILSYSLAAIELPVFAGAGSPQVFSLLALVMHLVSLAGATGIIGISDAV